ncbi:MAG: flagellar biosynthesis anti-sigma factor FlgM [Lachnospiraceae bacterium]|nr:flagellar biosynthesis anti-sigma factor FlgM [Lachnospiraceae bacterium]MBQ7833858.1 flagellar biosynthesis anti-sigma factor FlgM [Lachnospiraceae bacterium]
MRIQSYIQVQQLYNTQKTNRTQKSTQTSFSDKLQISTMGKDIQTAKAALANTSDIREDKIADIKSAIKDGSYEISNESFADKLLERFSQTLA